MLNQKNYPKVFVYDTSTYTDMSVYALGFGRDYFDGHIHTNHYLYFGRVKPFDAIYIEMGAQANNVSSTMAVEYYNGTTWVDVSNLLDDTLCFNRSGFVQFDKPEDWESITVNSEDKYFIRISPSVNTRNNMHIQGMNILFSDDQDLNGVYPGVTSYFRDAETSFVLRHENSRDLIVQDVRNSGARKKGTLKSYYEQIEAWDLLHINEVKMWSVYLTLENIFSGLQSKDSDLYKQKADEYKIKAEQYKAAFYLTIDKDDDGIADNEEQAGDISVRKLVRK